MMTTHTDTALTLNCTSVMVSVLYRYASLSLTLVLLACQLYAAWFWFTGGLEVNGGEVTGAKVIMLGSRSGSAPLLAVFRELALQAPVGK